MEGINFVDVRNETRVRIRLRNYLLLNFIIESQMNGSHILKVEPPTSKRYALSWVSVEYPLGTSKTKKGSRFEMLPAGGR